MNKKDEEIQKKLEELETTILRETPTTKPNMPAIPDRTTGLSTGSHAVSTKEEATTVKSDLCYFGGIGLIMLGLFMMFQHIRVGTGFFNMLGMGGGGFGLLLIPLMIGLGWLFYDSKNKIAWLLTAGSCALIVLSVIASLVMVFPMLSLTQMIIMLLPFAIGGGLLLKGIGGPKAIEDKLKKSKS
jgi:hypothetical protein